MDNIDLVDWEPMTNAATGAALTMKQLTEAMRQLIAGVQPIQTLPLLPNDAKEGGETMQDDEFDEYDEDDLDQAPARQPAPNGEDQFWRFIPAHSLPEDAVIDDFFMRAYGLEDVVILPNYEHPTTGARGLAFVCTDGRLGDVLHAFGLRLSSKWKWEYPTGVGWDGNQPLYLLETPIRMKRRPRLPAPPKRVVPSDDGHMVEEELKPYDRSREEYAQLVSAHEKEKLQELDQLVQTREALVRDLGVRLNEAYNALADGHEELETFKASKEDRQEALAKEFDVLTGVEGIERAWTQGDTLYVDTDVIVCAGKPIGRFNIGINLRTRKITKLENREPYLRTDRGGRGYHHPHVFDGAVGDGICWGNAGKTIFDAISQRQFGAALTHVLNFLSTYNVKGHGYGGYDESYNHLVAQFKRNHPHWRPGDKLDGQKPKPKRTRVKPKPTATAEATKVKPTKVREPATTAGVTPNYGGPFGTDDEGTVAEL